MLLMDWYIPQLLIIRRVINPGKQIIDSAVWGKFKISKQQLLRLWIPATSKNACFTKTGEIIKRIKKANRLKKW